MDLSLLFLIYNLFSQKTVLEATSIGLVDEAKESCTGTRRTATCVAPRHVDASRDALLFWSSVLFVIFVRRALCFYLYLLSFVLLPSINTIKYYYMNIIATWRTINSIILLVHIATWRGGGVRCQTFSFCSLFLDLADHERDRPPCARSIVFFRSATKTLNVKQHRV